MGKNLINSGQNSFKFDEKYKPTLSVYTKHKKCEEIYTKSLLKTCDKKKILKSAKGKKRYFVQKNKDKDNSIFLVRNNANKQKNNAAISLKYSN